MSRPKDRLPPVDGLLVVDKARDMTSHDVVDVARQVLGFRRIGHTGTLDPQATGVLVLCLGKATRLTAAITNTDKSYRGVIRLGLATDTYDGDGDPLGDPRPVAAGREDVERAFEAFRGAFLQTPPPYSAKRVGGRKLYEYARKGKPVDPPPKRVTVTRLEIESFEGDRVAFLCECTAGTYVRSIAHGTGQALGCGGYLESLVRIRNGPFKIEDGLPVAELKGMAREDVLRRVIPLAEIPVNILRAAAPAPTGTPPRGP